MPKLEANVSIVSLFRSNQDALTWNMKQKAPSLPYFLAYGYKILAYDCVFVEFGSIFETV